MKPGSLHIDFPIPAMISKTDWDMIQRKTEANKVRSKRASDVSKPYWLRDLLMCGHCRGPVKPHHGRKRKDGTFPRYHSCYWASASPQTLALSGKKKKCSLPYLKAKDLESAVWQNIIKPLVFGNKKERLSQLVDPLKYDIDIKAIDDKILRFENELKRKQTARDRMFDWIGDDFFDKNELKKRLHLNQDEILLIEAQLNDVKKERKDLQEAKENDHLLKDFLQNKGHVLKRLVKDLLNLSHGDRKVFVESMVDGKFKLKSSGKEFDRPAWEMEGPKTNLNISILQEFMDKGKIGKLDKNSPHDTTADHF